MFSKNFTIKFFIILILLFSLSAFLFVNHTFAEQAEQKQTTATKQTDKYGLGEAAGKAGLKTEKNIPALVGEIIKIAINFVGLIFFVLIVYGGFLWMTAGGNEEQVVKAKKLISQATIGLIIVIGAYAVTYFVTSTLLEAVGQ